MSHVVWHDVECGGYSQDLRLWRELAAAAAGPVLDVGAGTGRVTLHLARRGFDVTALDRDTALLAALRERAGDTPVATVCADARDFALDRRFALVLVPMQTVQLLGGAEGRTGFLRAAREHLEPGGLLALAIADALDAFDEEGHRSPTGEWSEPPVPDVREVGGVLYASRPVALRDEGTRVTIERIRETVDGDGARTAEGDVIHLDRLDAATLGREGAAAGLRPLPPRGIAQTEEHVGSTVVMLRG